MIEHVKSILATSRNITVLTGAGVSAESGIPTYRDPDGLWNTYRAQDFSSLESFSSTPAVVWDWYHERRAAMAQAEPNAAHKAVADLERMVHQVVVLTQNIDGLHQRAGSTLVHELHGSVWNIKCVDCGEVRCEPSSNVKIPACYSCHGMMRPAVVWFGESLERRVWDKAMRATRCDTFLVVGTSGLVDPVAKLVGFARDNKARIIEVNTENTSISDIADYTLLGKAGEILPQLVTADGEVPADFMGMHDMDLGRAFHRGLTKFFDRHPELKDKLKKH